MVIAANSGKLTTTKGMLIISVFLASAGIIFLPLAKLFFVFRYINNKPCKTLNYQSTSSLSSW
jgi:hypothetical protein